MGKLLKVLAKEKADKGFDILRDIYERRKANSMNPDELLKREIEVHELLFDEKKLPLNPLVSSNYRPLKSKGLIYTDGDIIRIREAYFRYVVNDADISQSGQAYKGKNGLYRKRRPDDFELHYYSEAMMRYSYLKYLINNFTEQSQQKVKTKKLQNPVIAAFCYFLNDSEFYKKELNEANGPFCERVCKEFDLRYTDNVRQNFNKGDAKVKAKKVKELILPQIDKELSNKISAYLDNKYNLYG